MAGCRVDHVRRHAQRWNDAGRRPLSKEFHAQDGRRGQHCPERGLSQHAKPLVAAESCAAVGQCEPALSLSGLQPRFENVALAAELAKGGVQFGHPQVDFIAFVAL